MAKLKLGDTGMKTWKDWLFVWAFIFGFYWLVMHQLLWVFISVVILVIGGVNLIEAIDSRKAKRQIK